MEISQIIKLFDVPEGSYQVEPLTSGHINKTFKITSQNKQPYILQSVSTVAFPNIPLIMKNIWEMENHLKKSSHPGFSMTNVPELILTKSGQTYLKLENGDYWRLFNFIDGVSLEHTENRYQAEEAGRLYGSFLAAISDLEPSKLGETIKDFHSIELRLKQFDQALDEGDNERKEIANSEIDWVQEMRGEAQSWYLKMTDPGLKQRVAHYDTKLSNILFNKQGKAIAVIDFDTLMPGYLAFDYGDSVRTICSTTREDDPDLAATNYDIELIQSFSKGFIGALEGVITPEERQSFEYAVAYMPFIMGLRMLTDYLNNDQYYSTKYPNHNLDRCRNQFKLVESAKALSAKITNIIAS